MITVTGHTDAEGKLIFDREDFRLPENARFTIVVVASGLDEYAHKITPEPSVKTVASGDLEPAIFNWDAARFEKARRILKGYNGNPADEVIADRDERC